MALDFVSGLQEGKKTNGTRWHQATQKSGNCDSAGWRQAVLHGGKLINENMPAEPNESFRLEDLEGDHNLKIAAIK